MEKIVTKIDALPKLDRKINVAAYARVSSGKDAMLHSLSAQVSYYNRMIQQNKDGNFVGVYVDEAISGTKDNRKEFQKLINECRKGNVDLIITKSISRFARNLVTLLEVARELKQKGVDIYFEEQNLHSIDSKGELILTILASVAQEEARSVSTNMKWRIKRDFVEGISWGYKHCLGYEVKDKKYVVVAEEAELVKHIFKMYLDGYGVQKIANVINKEGYVSVRGFKFSRSMITCILRNISYTGNMLLQKTYRVSYLTKLTRKNNGEYDQYFCEGSHETIISMEDYKKVQEIRCERAKKIDAKESSHKRYALSGKIKCGICGKSYKHKQTQYKEKWVCATFNDLGKEKCPSKQITQSQLENAIVRVLGLDNYTEKAISQIDKIVVLPENRLEFHLTSGEVKTITAKKESRSESWTEEKRALAREKALQQFKTKEGGFTNGKDNGNTIND